MHVLSSSFFTIMFWSGKKPNLANMCTHATVLLSYANRRGKRWPRKMAHRGKWGDNTPILLNERREHNAMEMPAILLFGRHATGKEDVLWSKSCLSRAAYLPLER
ncbi:hypothetical protein HNY73_022944 [Argiope bruennichi]|uniref:Uncharacterized protein n=1 Tax=Argiope bruennichi TaxID=94029 RepID=A0A8T0E3B7_ARGBR|nr:hypothetical protein HNY73_022944 [Argiope bruennichi]